MIPTLFFSDFVFQAFFPAVLQFKRGLGQSATFQLSTSVAHNSNEPRLTGVVFYEQEVDNIFTLTLLFFVNVRPVDTN
jgi:hypothetical protein